MVKARIDVLPDKKPAYRQSGLIWLGISVFIVILDQLTKALVSQNLEYRQVIEILPVFNLTLAHNYGAAFSMLSDAGGWQRWFFAALAATASILIIGWLRAVPRSQRCFGISLALILGGALGNLIDRLIFGYVIDFLDFYWGSAHFPAFNLADSAITVGAVLMLFYSFFLEPKSKPA